MTMCWSAQEFEFCLNLKFTIFLETTYQPEKIPQRDMMEPPKFTQPLTDRTTTRGYSTHLFCCVRGFPQVSGSSMGSIASACGQPPVGGWRCWEMVCRVGLGVGEVRGLQLPSETNCDKFRVFLHRDGRLVLIKTSRALFPSVLGEEVRSSGQGSRIGALALQYTSVCEFPPCSPPSGRAKAKAEGGGCILRPVRFLLALNEQMLLPSSPKSSG